MKIIDFHTHPIMYQEQSLVMYKDAVQLDADGFQAFLRSRGIQTFCGSVLQPQHIASKEDKTAMFLGYSELLNALDSGSTTKLTICNKQVNRQAFEDTVLRPQRGDSLDGLVDEFNGMLESKISGSSASVEQERFITVSVHKKNVDEARTFFSRVTGEVSSKLSRLNSSSNELDAAERLDVLPGFFRPEEAALPFDLQSAMKRGHNLKDTICPDSLEFHRDYFKMGNQYGRVLFLKDYAS